VDPLEVAARVAAALEALGIAYSIGGSLAGSFAGEPRATLDIDVVVALETQHVPAVVRALEDGFYIDSEAVHRAVSPTVSGAMSWASCVCRGDSWTSST